MNSCVLRTSYFLFGCSFVHWDVKQKFFFLVKSGTADEKKLYLIDLVLRTSMSSQIIKYNVSLFKHHLSILLGCYLYDNDLMFRLINNNNEYDIVDSKIQSYGILILFYSFYTTLIFGDQRCFLLVYLIIHIIRLHLYCKLDRVYMIIGLVFWLLQDKNTTIRKWKILPP